MVQTTGGDIVKTAQGNSSTPPQSGKEKTKKFDVLMSGITVPTNNEELNLPEETNPYICIYVELPETLDKPLHITGFEYVKNTSNGSKNSNQYVHHAVLYNCTEEESLLQRERGHFHATTYLQNVKYLSWRLLAFINSSPFR
jgi:hypothetical protein